MTPTLDDLFAVIDGTWPAAKIHSHGPWQIREGLGGGQRVSAATAMGAVGNKDITQAEAAMDGLGQGRIFMIRPGDSALDALLETRGYAVVDPVNIYLCPVQDLARNAPPRLSTFEITEPLAVMREIWDEGGIGSARLNVMKRTTGPRSYLFGRIEDRPAGAAFVAAHNGVAMLHALEIKRKHQRKGLGRYLMWQAARWANGQGLPWLSVICTKANDGANGLYKSIGMTAMGGYHYRRWVEK